jgi:diacylglycerol kinase (ATP)
MTRYKLIVNPTAGRGAGEQAVPRITELLSAHGLDFDLVRTERPWHAAQLTEEACAAGYDVVVAVGGDGTANEVLNGLLRVRHDGPASGPALGVLEVGRGNDFGFGVGIPHGLEAACQVLADAHRRTIDVGWVAGGLYPQGRYFCNGVGIGFDAVVGFEAAKMRRLRGAASYIVAALKTVLLFPTGPLVKIEFDGQTLTERALMVSVMNGSRLGGLFMMAPLARPDDGYFDVCIAGRLSRPGILAMIPRFISGTQAGRRAITTCRAETLTVTALQGSLPAHADGETVSVDGGRLTLELRAAQIDIITGAATT